jgi:hypothetical protein
MYFGLAQPVHRYWLHNSTPARAEHLRTQFKMLYPITYPAIGREFSSQLDTTDRQALAVWIYKVVGDHGLISLSIRSRHAQHVTAR